MGWSFICPGCGKTLDIDDFGNSMPTAEVKLVNGECCGNCGRDLTSSHQRAIRFITEIIEERRQSKQQE